VDPSSSVPALEGLAIEAVEWLPSGSDAGLVRVRGRWTDLGRSERELPALGLRRGPESRRFESLPDARFGRDPAVWRATYLVPAALMDPPPDELWLAWDSGVRAGLPAPTHGFEPPATPPTPVEPEPEGEVIDRAVLAERRARRAEASERAQAQRAAEALKAVEVLELRSAELERRLEALQAEQPPDGEVAPEPSGLVEAERESSGEAAVKPADDADPPDSSAAASLAAAPAALHATPAAIPSAPRADALATAVATVKGLRGELADQRQRVRRSELLRAADAVALASLQEEHGRAHRLEEQLAVSERDLARAITDAEAAAAEALSAREQAAEQVALAQQRAAADAAAVRTRTAEELAAERERAAAAQSAVAEARAELQVARRDLASTRERLAARERELSAIGAELRALREELERVRHDAAGRSADLERRLAELDAALAAERRGHAGTTTELESARAQVALAEAANRAESVARAALDEEIDRERLARATLAEALDVARSELAHAQAFQADLVLSREQARAEASAGQTELAAARAEGDSARQAAEELRAALAAARAEGDSARQAAEQEAEELRVALAAARAGSGRTEGALAAARQELEAARLRIAQLERELEERRASVEHQTGGLLARIAELERSADDDLERRAREQAEAAAAAARPADAERDALSANLDAAAAALRARVDVPDPAASQAPEPAAMATPAQPVPDAPVDPSAESAPVVSAADAVAASPSGEAARVAAPARAPASTPPPRPRIVTEAKHPARADVVGSSTREYPWLRGALVKLAHDDPRAATRLLLGLVPVQRALVAPPVEYDLTIRGDGTYAISIGQQGATAKPLPGPRPRRQAAYHVSADVVTLAELLAGVPKRMGRWFGPIKVHGRRRGAEALRDALVGARLDLAAAARAGAEPEPELVFRAFAYAIHPAWTKGHSFTVAQEIADPSPQRWHVVVRDGAPVAVERRATSAPDAVVTMSRATYLHLLRGEQAPSGERPAIRGDRAAVALLRAWTERAQGQGA
jgi:hypothetical protein